MTRAGVLVACLAAALAAGSPVRPHAQAAATADGIAGLLEQIQRALVSGTAADYMALLATGASESSASSFAAPLFKTAVSRATLRERDRVPLPGAIAGHGYRVLVEALVERGRAGTIFTWQFEVRRSLDNPDRWFIGGQEQISSLDGLFQLQLDTSRQFVARDLTIAATDFLLTLPRGHAFVAETNAGVTCLVLVGSGTMRFAPTPAAERGQVRIFAGVETLEQPFDVALVRFHPSEYAERVSFGALIAGPVDQDRARRAQAFFDAHAGQSFAIALEDLSAGHWSLTPSPGDFLADVNTRKYNTLTFARSSGEAEDITLFDRRRRKNIALYASPQKLESRGRFYNEDDLAEFDVLSYDIDATIAPERELLDGRATLSVRIRDAAISNLSLKLAEGLNVRSILSPQLGRLMYFRVIGQNGIVVTLPSLVYKGQQFSFTVNYAGRVAPQELDREAVALGARQAQSDLPILQPEPRFIYSNRGYWYPQPDVADYAVARMRISIPEGYGCVGSGELIESKTVVVPGERGEARRRQFTFETSRPLRYLACVVSRFVAPHSITIPLATGMSGAEGASAGAAAADGDGERPFRVTVVANPRQESRGRAFAQDAASMVRFYSALAGDTPYPSLTLAVTESALPGGHSPAYFAILNQPPIMSHLSWRNDPVNFEGYPSFFLAHEVAHQWWGQAVGWENYHEQWISEGFAQYFALLYAREEQGQNTFMDVLRQMRRWAVDHSDQGPISLGYRLGHIRNDSRIFRAIIYNKAALVLHMLRRLIGDAAFDRGLRRFYHQNRFRKAGTDDVRRAFEMESGEDLARFFEGWIFTADLPTVGIVRQIVPGAPPSVKLTLEQQQPELFDMVIPIELRYTSGRSDVHEIHLRERTTEVTVPLGGQLREIEPDPERITLARFR